MSRKNSVKSSVVTKRMNDMQISERMIANHIMQSVKDVTAWLKGELEFPYKYVWMVCELLNIDIMDLLKDRKSSFH